ncbi:uncharacterized protein LOC128882604 [Hylaeus volcanicus]|uniref:uncharacterized protein LOC128882604 n=1 Tax=Hylaeus volcanicus TaxID=313075 RepID=UPI0023B7D24F|nr:uncharacterized protein LOC128882604 [Hylaeus volcanicus]
MPKTSDALFHALQKKFLLSALELNLRCDGRELLDFREVKIDFHSKTRGNVKIQLGATQVLCIVTGEIVQVASDQSHDGFINFYVHISPMAREDAEVSNAASSNCFQQASKIAYTVESILRRSRALDTEGLYIEADSKLWSLTINIHVLNDDGNLIDVCGLAALAALLHFRRDKVCKAQENVSESERMPPTPLSLHHLPVPVTVTFFESTTRPFVLDATRQEECLSSGQITIAINQFKELCGIYKSGGQPVDKEMLHYTLRVAVNRANDILHLLQESLKSHELLREKQRKNIWNIYGSSAFVSVFPNKDCETKFLTTISSLNLAAYENNASETFKNYEDHHKKTTLEKQMELVKRAQVKDNELKQVCATDETAELLLKETTEASPKVLKDIEIPVDKTTLHPTLQSASGREEPVLTGTEETVLPLENEFSDGDFQQAVVKKPEKKKSKKRKTSLKH